jgi:hypothetical protein
MMSRLSEEKSLVPNRLRDITVARLTPTQPGTIDAPDHQVRIRSKRNRGAQRPVRNWLGRDRREFAPINQLAFAQENFIKHAGTLTRFS